MSNTQNTKPAPADAGAASPCPDDLDAWIEDGELATTTLPVCIRGDLQAERGRIAEEVVAAAGRLMAAKQAAGRKLADPAVKAAEAEIEGLKVRLADVDERMRASTRPFVLRAITRDEADDLMVDNPPRKDNERDSKLGYNVKAVRDATVQLCTVSPVLTAAQWVKLLPKLNAGQLDTIHAACDTLTYELVRAPFSPGVSVTSPSSADE